MQIFAFRGNCVSNLPSLIICIFCDFAALVETRVSHLALEIGKQTVEETFVISKWSLEAIKLMVPLAFIEGYR